ncbi:hypothetical protein [Chitinimonas koreensis]|uniref:hypothetical protein n=1 Tax=Chitinimonas koreensis TaxID=356302 RepID=UPI0004048BAF|nr:hypothetical protein [Chitinimonas koreensis]QNM98252.1 hypothetical protein H9L41_08440 [Chitinimonas koreensis]
MSLLRLDHEGRPIELAPAGRLWLPLHGQLREQAFGHAARQLAGPHGWLPGEGGLVANLRVWENCLLAHNYFGGPPAAADEALLIELMARCGLAGQDAQAFMAAPAGSLSAKRRRLACALRALLARPRLILAEGEWFGGLGDDEVEPLAAAFAELCPDAAWLVLGGARPDTVWGFPDREKTGGTATPA